MNTSDHDTITWSPVPNDAPPATPFYQQMIALIAANADQIDEGTVTMDKDGSWAFTILTKPTRQDPEQPYENQQGV